MSCKLAQLNLSGTVRRNKLWISCGLGESLKAVSLTIFKPLYNKLTVFIWSSSGGQNLLLRWTLLFWSVLLKNSMFFFSLRMVRHLVYVLAFTMWTHTHTHTHTHTFWFERLNGAEEHSHIRSVHGQKLNTLVRNGKKFNLVETFGTAPKQNLTESSFLYNKMSISNSNLKHMFRLMTLYKKYAFAKYRLWKNILFHNNALNLL